VPAADQQRDASDDTSLEGDAAHLQRNFVERSGVAPESR
jgi:hypothetical protein